jgi:hypothetical protein
VVPTVPAFVSDEYGANAMVVSAALFDDLKTINEYGMVAVPSWEVTTTLMVVVPTGVRILPEAVPGATVTPFTVTVAAGLVVVGVTVTDAVVLLTELK